MLSATVCAFDEFSLDTVVSSRSLGDDEGTIADLMVLGADENITYKLELKLNFLINFG